jgi:broad specificity phosphatase PhoE
MMPLTLTLVRHGESESNRAKRAFEQGEVLPAEAELMKVHTSDRRLTPKGEEQAIAAGIWLRRWMQTTDIEIADCRFYVSPYVRAMETAGHIQIPKARWRLENRLVERNWGDLDQMTFEDRLQMFGNEIKKRKEYAFFWRPGTGETMQDVFGRLRDLMDSLHRECERKHVFLVCHGETMWAARTILEYWSPQLLRDHMLEHDDRTGIHNCRIVQYTRVLNKEHRSDRLSRVRFVDPVHPLDASRNLGWQKVSRTLLSSDELLQVCGESKRFLSAK